MRKALFVLASALLLSGPALGVSCPKGTTTVAIDGDIDTDATLSLRWRQKFLDAIFDSHRYCFVTSKDDAEVIVLVSTIDTDAHDIRNDRAAISTVAVFAENMKFIMHLLQLCSAVSVDSCAEHTLTQLDNQLTHYPEELRPKEKQ
jgi:hypothetical protein